MSGGPRLSDGKLGAVNVAPGAVAEVLVGEDEPELLKLEGAGLIAEGTLSDRIGSVGTGLTIGIGMNVESLPLKLSGREAVGRDIPSEGMLNEGTLNDGGPRVGSVMLRLGVEIVRDGIARDGRAGEGMLKDGKPIVGSETLRLGD